MQKKDGSHGRSSTILNIIREPICAIDSSFAGTLFAWTFLSARRFPLAHWAAAICYNPVAMTTSDTVLVPAMTLANAKGDGPSVDVSGASNRVFLVTLAITKIIEQESLDVNIVGSADGATWGAKSLAAFPQKFYCGEWPLLLELTAHPDVKFVRAHWEVARWGRGTETPMFEFGVRLKEVPADILKAVAAEARTMA
jgi:hypothetical protein